MRFSPVFSLALLLSLLLPGRLPAQCNPYFASPLSPRTTNYDIRARLHHAEQRIEATQTITFTNASPVAISELRIYLYLNAFKNTRTSFLSGTSRIFGQTFAERQPDEWGWIDIARISRIGGADLSRQMQYVQPDDGNPDDQTVLRVLLDQPLLPGQTARFELAWQAKMPKTIARVGYNRDFYLFCHWFPQLGVWEPARDGVWGWNCHQFMRSTEFYADFGVYDVHLTVPDRFVLGASGCLVDEHHNGDGTITRHYHAEDVIDFAWSVYPRFEVHEDHWRQVQIRLLSPPEHAAMVPRYLHALKYAFEYMDRHIGPYPYPTLTVVDPPFHSLRSGLMEYPTLITVGTFAGLPGGIRTSESLIVHEFVHQYFMGILASNEKEEPWLDEGFVTYFEDRIIDAAYGERQSLIHFMGYHMDNRQLTRTEYTAMYNPREGIVARPGWAFGENNYKSLVYSKTATALRTVEALIGSEKMDSILRAYFHAWEFRHPGGPDFMAALSTGLSTLPDTAFARQVYRLFERSIYQALVMDYAVTRISNEVLPARQGYFGNSPAEFEYVDGKTAPLPTRSEVQVQRNGDWTFPVTLLVAFEDGSRDTLLWSGEEGEKVFVFEHRAPVCWATVDPHQQLFLDIDLNNNSLTLHPDSRPLWKYSAKVLFWIQNALQTLSFLT